MESSQAGHFEAYQGEISEQGHSERPQKPFARGKKMTKGRNQVKIPTNLATGTSKHTRFAALLGQNKGRIAKPKTGAGHSASQSGLHQNRATRVPQQISTAKDKTKMGCEMGSQLITVPVKLIHSPTIKLSTPSKRKPQDPILIPSRPVVLQKKANALAEKNPTAQIDLSPSGYFQVQISQEHSSAIARSCGLTTGDVQEALATENEERRVISSSPNQNFVTQEGYGDEGEWDDQGRFDPDSADDLEMETEDDA